MIRTIILGLIFSIAITLTFAINERTCHKCEGINCYRTSYNQTEKCLDSLDICATVFDNDGVVQRGCLLNLPDKHRSKCESRKHHLDCHKCNENLCNNLNREDLLCVQCDSQTNPKCANAGEIAPTRCTIGNSANSYCFIDRNGNNIIRGCATDVRHQRECFGSVNCMLCMPGDIKGCNSIDFIPGSSRSFMIY